MFRREKTDRAPKKKGYAWQLPRPVRNALISAGILLVVLVVAGTGYTLYMDMNGSAAKDLAAANPASQSLSAPIKPATPSPNAREGAAVEIVTSPVSVGSEASITVQTNPTSICKITVIYNYDYAKKQTPVSDPALQPQTADAYGTVSWTWMVSPAAAIGKGNVNVTCTYNGRSGVVAADLMVTK